MVGIVLKGRSNQASPAYFCPSTTLTYHAQSLEPGDPPCLLQMQARRITARTRPDFLIHWPSRIEVRHYLFQLAPGIGLPRRNRRRSVRFHPAAVKRDREVVLKVARLENWMLLPRHLALHPLRDVIEDLEHPNPGLFSRIPARSAAACLKCPSLSSSPPTSISPFFRNLSNTSSFTKTSCQIFRARLLR